MTTTENKRKRHRSFENDFTARSKYFVNERMVNSSDQQYMQKIFDKTVGLLFEGAKNNSNNNRVYECKKERFKKIRLDGDGNIIFLDGTLIPTFDEKIRCVSCGKDSLIQSECSNCNLNLCEYCGISCANCVETHLCKHCLQLFEGNVNGQPCCRACKIFT